MAKEGYKRLAALLTAGALTAGMCCGAALAADAPQAQEETQLSVQTGAVSFDQLGESIRAGNYTVLALEENIATIEALDYDKIADDTRNGINALASYQWFMSRMGQSLAAQSVKAQYDALRETFDDLKDGTIEKENADVVRQLRNAQDQVVMAGESLYIALVELERNDASLDRSLAAMDRTVQEMELRHSLGQISDLTLQQVKGGRVSLSSGQQTLEMNIGTMKLQLEMLLGAPLTGTVQLQQLPQVSDEQLDAMDLEADLAAAKDRSFSLYDAKKTLDDAEETFRDTGKNYTHNKKDYRYVQAQHTWQAAQYTYQATVQSFEGSFRTLYAQVKNYRQVLDAAQTALALEEANYAAIQLKYDQGAISQNALLSAQDDVAAARDTVEGAAIDLFSAYHSYRWAVDYGILN